MQFDVSKIHPATALQGVLLRASVAAMLLAGVAAPASAVPTQDAPAAAAPAGAQEPLRATFIDVVGKVQWRPAADAPWQEAKVNDVVDAGVEIRTGLRSRTAIRMRNATVLVDAGTLFQLPQAVKDGDVLRTTAAVKHGRADFKVDKVGLSNDFKVVTPSTTLAVRGTGFAVATGALKQVEVIGARRNAINAIELKYALNNSTVQLSGGAASSSTVNHPAHTAAVAASPPLAAAAAAPATSQSEVVQVATGGESPASAGSAAQAQQSNRSGNKGQKAQEIIGTPSSAGSGSGGAGGSGGSGLAERIRQQIERANRANLALEQSIEHLLQADGEVAEVAASRATVEDLKKLAEAKRSQALAALAEHEAALAKARAAETEALRRADGFDSRAASIEGRFEAFDDARTDARGRLDSLKAALDSGQPSDSQVATLAQVLRSALEQMGSERSTLRADQQFLLADKDAIITEVQRLDQPGPGGQPSARSIASEAAQRYADAIDALVGHVADGGSAADVAAASREAVAGLQALVAGLADDVGTAAVRSKADAALERLAKASDDLSAALAALESIKAAKAEAANDQRAASLGQVEAAYQRLVALRLRVIVEGAGLSEGIDRRERELFAAQEESAGALDAAGHRYEQGGAALLSQASESRSGAESGLADAQSALFGHEEALSAASLSADSIEEQGSGFDAGIVQLQARFAEFDAALAGSGGLESQLRELLQATSSPDGAVGEVADGLRAALGSLVEAGDAAAVAGQSLQADRDAVAAAVAALDGGPRAAAESAVAAYDSALSDLAARVAAGNGIEEAAESARGAVESLREVAAFLRDGSLPAAARALAESALARLGTATERLSSALDDLGAVRAARDEAAGDPRADRLGEVEALFGRAVAVRLRVLADWDQAQGGLADRESSRSAALASAADALDAAGQRYQQRGAAAGSAAAAAEAGASSAKGSALVALTDHASAVLSATSEEGSVARRESSFSGGAAAVEGGLATFASAQESASTAIGAIDAVLGDGRQGEGGGGQGTGEFASILGGSFPGGMPVSELAEDLRDSLVSLGDSGDAVRGAAAALRADIDSIEASASGVDSGARQQAAAAIAAFEAALGDLDARVRAGEGAAAVSGAANDAVDRLVDLADLVRSRVGEGPASGAVDRALAGFRSAAEGFGRSASALELVQAARTQVSDDARREAFGQVESAFVAIMEARARVLGEWAGIEVRLGEMDEDAASTVTDGHRALGRVGDHYALQSSVGSFLAGQHAASAELDLEDATAGVLEREVIASDAERLEVLALGVAEVEDAAGRASDDLVAIGSGSPGERASRVGTAIESLDDLESALVGAVAKAVAIDPELGDSLASTSLSSLSARAADALDSILSADSRSESAVGSIAGLATFVDGVQANADRLSVIAGELKERFGVSDEFALAVVAAVSQGAGSVADSSARAMVARDAIAGLVLVAQSDRFGSVVERIDGLLAARGWASSGGMDLLDQARAAHAAANEQGTGVFLGLAQGSRDSLVLAAQSVAGDIASLGQMASLSSQMVTALDGAEGAANEAERLRDETFGHRVAAEEHEANSQAGLARTTAAADDGDARGALAQSALTSGFAVAARSSADAAAVSADGAKGQATLAESFETDVNRLQPGVLAFGNNRNQFEQAAAARRAAIEGAEGGAVALRDDVVFYDGVVQALADRAGTSEAAGNAALSDDARQQAIALAAQLSGSAAQAAQLEQTATTNAGRLFGRSVSQYVGRAQAAANAAAQQAVLAAAAASNAEGNAQTAAAIASQAGGTSAQ